MHDARFRDYDVAPTILLVDDEPALLHVTARRLREAGCTVIECANGASAAELVEAHPIDLVLSDIDMPELSGIDLLKLLRERQIAVPVVLMTGAPTLDTAVKAVEHGAFKYLMKPVGHQDLLDAVDGALKSRDRASQGSRSSAPSRGGEPSHTDVRIAPGTVLAERYRLIRLLGAGGMGQVWEAAQMSTERSVAVKLLLSSLNANARSEMRKRLLREARAASSVEHPNVVDVFDLFELADGTPVLVMALLRGETLARRLADANVLSLATAADLLLPVVSAVGTAHAKGVIHRDLKPENVFLADDGGRTTVKVLDFGIAKLVSNGTHDGVVLTEAGAPMGTPGYMAPEQALGDLDVDHRADVWSLGAILYEALSGSRPLKADTLGQMMKELFTATIVPLSERMPKLPSSVAKLVDTMLARERENRPNDLREVYAELTRYTRVDAPGFGPPAVAQAEAPAAATPSNGALALASTELGTAPDRSR
jgi:eukaryotic-like serine/threonine-protein kinase